MPAFKRSPTRVLVIEDDPDFRANLVEWLQATGYRVTAAADGEEAIGIASVATFDVVVTDLKMPGVDGIQVLQWLKQQNKVAPTIFLSGEATIHDAIQALREYGGFDFLVKPLDDLTKLNRVIERALSSEIIALTPRHDADTTRESEKQPLAALVLSTIRERYREPIGLNEISAQLGYSPAYLTNALQRETGRTVQQWIIHHRLELAQELLRDTTWSVVRIAAEVGYSNQSHFGRQFRQNVGASPSEWREAHAQPQH